MDTYPALHSRAALGAARICRPGTARQQVTLDSPAMDVMTDLTQVAPAVIEPGATMEAAHQYMMQRGVRLLLALDQGDVLAGLITTTDILGEKPVSLARERGMRHSEILVSDLMTPASRLEAFDLARVASARVGHVISGLQEARRNHALVVQQDASGQLEIRGIFSLSQIARQLGMPLQLPEAAGTFAEIEAALAGG
ncbi:CBS domain-containing protein [Caenimonas aquaedulcis]|uniref:CBS domain-containing protein n=1 Tax=Caenimonas aquaedulcis TaxID=2793270 RepID=A0A931H1I6_9BURK|nr:CBS domain-containing protein [Caenimonas aquaedulcis]MBG9386874.1 CBS domain-containing protein [Caenimonas aquaedulcis]